MSLVKTVGTQPVKQEVRRDVFNIFDDLLDQWWSGSSAVPFFNREMGSFRPIVNLKETPTHYVVEAELPGLKKEEIDISLRDGSLHIKGEKKFSQEEKKEDYHRIESSYGFFSRSVALPDGVEAEKAEAELKNGVLKVQLKKTEKNASQRKISIQ